MLICCDPSDDTPGNRKTYTYIIPHNSRPERLLLMRTLSLVAGLEVRPVTKLDPSRSLGTLHISFTVGIS